MPTASKKGMYKVFETFYRAGIKSDLYCDLGGGMLEREGGLTSIPDCVMNAL